MRLSYKEKISKPTGFTGIKERDTFFQCTTAAFCTCRLSFPICLKSDVYLPHVRFEWKRSTSRKETDYGINKLFYNLSAYNKKNVDVCTHVLTSKKVASQTLKLFDTIRVLHDYRTSNKILNHGTLPRTIQHLRHICPFESYIYVQISLIW